MLLLLLTQRTPVVVGLHLMSATETRVISQSINQSFLKRYDDTGMGYSGVIIEIMGVT